VIVNFFVAGESEGIKDTGKTMRGRRLKSIYVSKTPKCQAEVLRLSLLTMQTHQLENIVVEFWLAFVINRLLVIINKHLNLFATRNTKKISS
jgi:hypothetical protein